ncbi:MAG: family 20 glycosylhydrolase [Bacteroidota bacterium]
MKRFFLYIIIILFTQIMIVNNKTYANIIPTPQIIKSLKGSFDITHDNIIIGYSEDTLEFTAQLIAQSLNDTYNLDTELTTNGGNIKLQIVDDLSIPIKVDKSVISQAYHLLIKENEIIIRGISEVGVFYGAMSLIQLIENSHSNSLQNLEVFDWPDMTVRGISDDISRGQVSTIDNFKRIIDFMARYKMNTYMPYLEDMLELDSYPSIGKQRGALTKSEINELVEFAGERFIDVIPIFQTLGHFENILSQKEFLEYAEYPGAASLSVTEAKTYLFIENMLNEVFELFPSEYINIGADESYDVGRGKSKDLAEKVGIAVVHANHYKKVYDICKKNNKKVLMYGDIILNHPKILELIPKDIIIVDWHYSASTNYESANIFQDAGFEYYVSPSVWNFRTTFPNYQTALPNIKSIINNGIRKASTGMINSNWGDYGAETFKEFVLYGYAWSAQCSWNFGESRISDFNDLFFTDFFGIKDDRLSDLYKIFSNQFNQMQWHEVWRHPLLPLKSGGWWESRTNREEAISWMEWTLPRAYEILDEFEMVVTKNGDHLELLRFLIFLDYWYINKLQTNYYLRQNLKLYSLKNKINQKKSESKELENEILWIEKELKSIDLSGMIKQNINELNNLKDQYENLWLNYYKPENLNLIIDKFDRLIAYFDETNEQILSDTLINPEIESNWLYCAKNRRSGYDKADFKKEFSIKGDINNAYLQLIGDSHAKLYINGEYIDEVFVSRSLSLVTEYKRYLLVDISDHLKTGKNKIEVKAASYRGRKGAGFNLISEINTDNGVQIIKSDKSWLCKPSGKKKRRWKKAIIKEYKYPVIAPNFNKERTSWIERE